MSAAYAAAQPIGSEARTLQGVWQVQVTPRSCASGAQVAPVINSLVTFHQGGTLSEVPASVPLLAAGRTPGQGTWTHAGGGLYEQKFIALITVTTPPGPTTGPGFQAGWQTVTQGVQVVDRDTFESAGTNAYYDVNGQIYREGCTTAIGRRFQ